MVYCTLFNRALRVSPVGGDGEPDCDWGGCGTWTVRNYSLSCTSVWSSFLDSGFCVAHKGRCPLPIVLCYVEMEWGELRGNCLIDPNIKEKITLIYVESDFKREKLINHAKHKVKNIKWFVIGPLLDWLSKKTNVTWDGSQLQTF